MHFTHAILLCALPLFGSLPASPAGAQTTLARLLGGLYQSSADSVTGIGDITGDGLSEMVLGSPTAAAGGRIMIFDSSGVYIREMATSYAQEMGRAVDGGDPWNGSGDVNADGRPDVLVGDPAVLKNGQPTGAVVVFSGAGGADPVLEILGVAPGGRFGSSVSMAGLVDGDANADLIVGAPEGDAPYAAVYSGADGRLLYLLPALQATDRTGDSVSGLNDIDGDGRNEFIVGSPFHNGADLATGMVRVFSGDSGLEILRFQGEVVNEQLGTSVAGAGDVDNDGVMDIIAGGDGGVVRIFSGADGSPLRVHTGAGGFGYAVCGAGDQDGDGVCDYVIGAPYADHLATDGGAATLYSGATGAALYTYVGHLANSWYGEALSYVDDTDGDGWPEFLVGGIGATSALLCTHVGPRLAEPVPGSAGQINSVTVSDVTPGFTVRLDYMLTSTMRPVINHDGLHFDVSFGYAPQSRTAVASTVTFTGPVPAGLANRSLYMQAQMIPPPGSEPWVDCAVTNLRYHRF
ncbi:MAG: hypothetical protein EYC70_02895 [Planctomycetota bacterium]|nr:MAG: hypothetical protein EYC70_02895 [Planctomycetota bacterium]